METLIPLRFALKLRLFRRMKGLSMGQISEKIGVSGDRYEDLESGQHEPRAGDIVAIMNALDLRFDATDFRERGIKI